MQRSLKPLFLCLLLLAGAQSPAADAPNAAEARLRESLKNTMLQLRAAQAESAAAQASKAELEAEKAALEASFEAFKKEVVAARAADAAAATALQAKLADSEAQAKRLDGELAKTKASDKQFRELAGAKEAERAKLAAQIIVLDRKVADQQTRNAALYKTGTEILSRYEKFGLGEALTAREPFVGVTKVKLQNLVQDYSDKLSDQKIKP
jgi:predicted  nucleic acid-binding Zn-ribbon protein